MNDNLPWWPAAGPVKVFFTISEPWGRNFAVAWTVVVNVAL